MTLSGVEPQTVSHFVSPEIQNRKDTTTVKPRDESTDKTAGQQEARGTAPVQDQVSLSQEAQVRSATSPETSKNNTFQQTPSPFDK